MRQKYSLGTIRHSLAHIMALAIKRVYKDVRFGVGPTVENGFYYDIEIEKEKSRDEKISQEELPRIEEEMKKIIKEGLPFVKQTVSLKEAKEIFKRLNQPYKLELLKDLEKYGTTDADVIARFAVASARRPKQSQGLPRSSKDSLAMTKNKIVTIYQVGEFIDLCRGPHLKNTKELPLSFKLTKISGAYWRGSEKNPMLSRLTGIAFENDKKLKDYLYFLAEAEKRDHRLLGQKLGLFHIDDEFGPGLILWHPKGAILKRIIENYALNEYLKNDYHLVSSPHIANLKLWNISGHTGFYRENMFPAMHLKEVNDEEKDDYQIKPMNCPFHILIYKNQIRSYRDLPLKYTELGTVYRYERSGTLHGLTRVRGITQDDAHVWCAPEQLAGELKKLLKLTLKILNRFGFKDFGIYVSTRPEKYVGSLKSWQIATKALEDTLKKEKVKYKIDKGGGVFYGPKIDIKINDSLGRQWQCTTIQVDFNLPERFKMFFIDKNGRKQQPIMIHRALLGSLERFIGVLIEHYAGSFPFWLSPIQVVVLPVKESNKLYAEKIEKILKENNLRTELWLSEETISKRIREAELNKIPYVLVVGDKEKKNKTVAVRQRGKGDLGSYFLEKFIEELAKEGEIKK